MIDRALLEAAKKEDWDYVDKRIPEISTNSEYIKWAQKLIYSENPNIRDLGVSILEKAKVSKEKFEEDIRYKLIPMMRKDENPYVRFRAACAIVNHNTVGRDEEEIKKILLEGEEDKDTSKIAKGYLNRLNHD